MTNNEEYFEIELYRMPGDVEDDTILEAAMKNLEDQMSLVNRFQIVREDGYTKVFGIFIEV